MSKLKVAVLISGSGTNLQALIDACSAQDYPAEIVLVISNKDTAYGLERAKKAAIATKVINHKEYKSREEFDKVMDAAIVQSGAEFVCMAGFMRLLSEWFVDKWHNKLINIHPSLLPSFKGIDGQKQALEAGVKLAGCTVHFVRKEMDAGPIIVQAAVPVLSSDTVESLSARILEKEHESYPLALKLVASGMAVVVGEIVEISD
ncbi:MAG: phosphoribosylglycinamide formyltransferase [Rickettsiaceae bacterium]|jgi:phosphoribosylglycinamide formyltransferase-1|nr:phosphoribosylglycinamide formyltransferase [Rickettsiaceae bacterium]